MNTIGTKASSPYTAKGLSSLSYNRIELAFSRSLLLSCSKKKVLLTFPVLALCGILVVFCRSVAVNASDWVAMSLLFLPILLSSGMLLSLGVLLVRLHERETKSLAIDFRRLIAGSIDLMIGTSYLSMPPVLIYLFLWVIMGVFFLLKEIPMLGEFFGIVFAFAPFLLIFSSLLLCLFNIGLLFFIAPAAALAPLKRTHLALRAWTSLQGRLLSSLALLLIAMIPTGVVVGLLSLAAVLTNASYLEAQESLTVGLEWFFIMIPFAALLTPAVNFFFNFASESYSLLRENG